MRIACLSLGFLLLSPFCRTQPEPLRFTHIGVPDGLSQDIVTAVCQDRQGFLWVGTEYGLNRYDGYTILTFRHDPEDSSSLSNNSVRTIVEDAGGRLWIGTDAGLNELVPGRLRFRRVPLPNGISYVSALLEDPKSTLWIGAQHLVRYEPDHSASRVFPPEGATEKIVQTIALDTTGVVWVGTSTGLERLLPGDSIRKPFRLFPSGAPEPDVRRLFLDSRHRLWVGTEHHGLIVLDPLHGNTLGVVRPHGEKEPLPSVIFSILEDGDGRILAGTWNGIIHIDPTTFAFRRLAADPNPAYALRSERVYALHLDRAGALWAGTWRGGLACYDPHRHRFSSASVPVSESGTASMSVLAVAEDRTGMIWAGMSDGLRTLDVTARTLRKAREPSRRHTPDGVSALLTDSAGCLWAGTLAGELYVRDLDTGPWRNIPLPVPDTPGSERAVRALLAAQSGELWVGTLQGLAIVSPDRHQVRFLRDNPDDTTDLAGSQVWSLAQTRDGTIWAGTWWEGAALNAWDARARRWSRPLEHATRRMPMVDRTVRAIVEDEHGMLWLGSWGMGITRYDRKSGQTRTFLESDGLPNLFVKSLALDGRGHLWIGTEQGLSRFTLPDGPFQNFTEEEGLQGYFFLAGSSCRAADGRLYFGGEKGLTIVDPARFKLKASPPPVVITDVRIYGRTAGDRWSPGAPLELRHGEDYLAFEFVALDFTAPDRNRFSFRLEGFEEEWGAPTTRRYVSYTHLPPGDYTFRVRAANLDGVWNETGTAIRVIITPPLWLRWWFLLLAGAALLGLLYLLYLYRVRRLLAVERTRSRIAEDLHDEIGGSLSGVRFLASAIHMDTGNRLSNDSTRFLGHIEDSTTAMQESLVDIVWAVNPEHDSWDQLFARCRRYASDLFDAGGILYTIETPPDPPRRPLGMEQRRNFWMVFKEMITNIVRHSGATRADVRMILAADGTLRVTVQDNGRGFDPGGPGGNGTRNIGRRIAALGGTATLQSAPGNGTRWEAGFRL